MRHTFLIARQEFIKYVTRRGFLLSILMFPLWIVIVTLVPKWTGGNDAPRHHVYAVVDRSGGTYAQVLTCAPVQQKRQQWLDGAQHYAATLTDRARLPDITKMVVPARDCGSEPDYTAIEAALRHAKTPGAPDFVGLADDTTLYPVKAPDYLAKASLASLDSAVRRALGTDGKTPLDTVIFIPAGYGTAPGATAEIWTTDRDPAFRQLVYDTLTREQRLEAVRRVAPSFANVEALDVSASVRSRTPFGEGTGGGTDQIVPIALAIILFVVSVMNSSVLLQGVVEEKSTRMIEVLLSCATPREITSGKLLGVIAVALTTLAIWALALFALMAIADRDTVSLVFASLRATASLETLPLLLVFFLCGLLIYGSLFLAIGSMANSLADAQSLLGPSMLILMLPNLMIAGVMRDPNGTLASTLSWVPVYTPFFMMLRISSHPPVWQLWGTTILAITTTVLMIIWTGRVFAKHVLTTERPPSLGKLVAGLFGKRS